MRKIETAEIKEKKADRNKRVIGIIIGLIMIFSSLGYAFFSSEKTTSSKVRYGEHVFQNENGYWTTEVNDIQYATSYTPYDTENISSPAVSLSNYNGKELYFSYDSEGEAVNEIAMNIERFALRAQQACVQGEKCEGDFPVKNCSSNLIIIREADKTRINKEDNCVYILSPANESILAADAFIFKLMGIK